MKIKVEVLERQSAKNNCRTNVRSLLTFFGRDKKTADKLLHFNGRDTWYHVAHVVSHPNECDRCCHVYLNMTRYESRSFDYDKSLPCVMSQPKGETSHPFKGDT